MKILKIAKEVNSGDVCVLVMTVIIIIIVFILTVSHCVITIIITAIIIITIIIIVTTTTTTTTPTTGIELNNGRAAQMGILALMVHEKLDNNPYIINDLLGAPVPFNAGL